MPNSVAPGYITIESTSVYGPHEAEIPVNTIDINESDPVSSTIQPWVGVGVDWAVMTNELVGLLADRYPTTYTFDRATLWSKPTPDDLPTFVASVALSIPGTVAVPGWSKATQETITARDTAGYIVKLIELDFASTNTFDRQVTLVAAGLTDLWAAWSDEGNGWSSRAGFRPATFIQTTRTLNEELRRRYRMT